MLKILTKFAQFAQKCQKHLTKFTMEAWLASVVEHFSGELIKRPKIRFLSAKKATTVWSLQKPGENVKNAGKNGKIWLEKLMS